MSVQGRVRVVDIVQAGNETVNPYVVGDTVLELQDVYDFDEDGGTVTIAGVNYAYINKDDVASTITLAAPGLASDIDAETAVDLYPVAQTKVALVDLEEEEEGVLAHIPYNMQQQFTDEIRDPEDQESVLLDFDGNAWVIIDVIGEIPFIDGQYIDTSTIPPAPTSDGNPPATSPAATVMGGIGALFVRWTAIDNPDPVTYEVHVSTDAGFLPVQGDATTLVTETAGTQATMRKLPDGTAPAYGTPYTFRIIAKDVDGAAAPGAPGTDAMYQVDTPDVAASFIYAGTILFDQMVGGTLDSEVVLASTIKTSNSGARMELSNTGAVWYDSDEKPVISLPTDISDTNPASFAGEVTASNATITGDLTVRGTSNEFSRGAQVQLQSNTSASATAPTVVVDYYSGVLAPDNSDGSFVGSLYWDAPNSRWLIGKKHNDGTVFLLSYDAAFNYLGVVGSGLSQGAANNNITRVVRLNGVNYFLWWSGSSKEWLVDKVPDTGMQLTSWKVPTVTDHTPYLGTDGTSLIVVQLDDRTSTNKYQTWWLNSNMSVLTSPSVSLTSANNNNCNGVYHGSGDFGSDRVLFAEHGSNTVISCTVNSTLNGVPSGLVHNANEDFLLAASPQGLGYDGSKFWTLGDDGTMYRYEGGGNTWNTDPNHTATCWAGFTWKDTNTAGTITGGADAQHETALSAMRQFSLPKRARATVSTPAIPYYGGVDDPNAIRVFMAKWSTQPGYTSMIYQGTPAADPSNPSITLTSFTVTNMLTSGSSAPDPNNLPQPFPGSTPAAIYSSALRRDGQPKARIAGDGTATLDGLIPPGSVIMTVAAAAPAGWLLCQGQAVSRTTYADLFAVIGTQYGAGDGSTTFNLPDMQLRLPLGAWASSGVFALGMVDTHSSMTARSDSHSHLHAHTIPGQPAGGTYRSSGSGGFNVVSQTLFEGHAHGGSTSSDVGLSNTEQSAHAYTALNYLIKV